MAALASLARSPLPLPLATLSARRSILALENLAAAVEDARARGFTEPDPRTDLGGVDMARKALILARMLGARLELGGGLGIGPRIEHFCVVRRGAGVGAEAETVGADVPLGIGAHHVDQQQSGAARGAFGQIAGGFSRLGDVALFDAGALHDPVRRGLDHLFEFGVGDHFFGQIAACTDYPGIVQRACLSA